MTLEEVEAAARARFGWPPVNERDYRSFAWAATNADTCTTHRVAAWFQPEGYEYDYVSGDPVGYKPAGIHVSGKGMCNTLDEACQALWDAVQRQTEPALLAMFGLKRDTNAYGSPVMPAGRELTRNDYADILIQNGIW